MPLRFQQVGETPKQTPEGLASPAGDQDEDGLRGEGSSGEEGGPGVSLTRSLSPGAGGKPWALLRQRPLFRVNYFGFISLSFPPLSLSLQQLFFVVSGIYEVLFFIQKMGSDEPRTLPAVTVVCQRAPGRRVLSRATPSGALSSPFHHPLCQTRSFPRGDGLGSFQNTDSCGKSICALLVSSTFITAPVVWLLRRACWRRGG